MKFTNPLEYNKLYQSKFEYYKNVWLYTVIISAVASTTYWISDCQLFGRIAYETIVPRFSIFIPLASFLLFRDRLNDYRKAIPISYLILHAIMWCTIWAIYYLPIKQHANEGFIIMHLMFLGLGFAAPRTWSIFFHSLLIFDIIISYPINHYESIDLMMTLGIPALVAIEVLMWIIENTYKEQYEIREQLNNLAKYDQLTKAYNRNKLIDVCKDSSSELKFSGAYALLMDIDHFKNVNDTYGHDVGDLILMDLVKIVKSSLRDTDYLIRWGGEEFLVILVKYDEVAVLNTAQKIRKAVENNDKSKCKFTISIGAARYKGGDYHDLVKSADIALYKAKNTGRNKVVLFRDDMVK